MVLEPVLSDAFVNKYTFRVGLTMLPEILALTILNQMKQISKLMIFIQYYTHNI